MSNDVQADVKKGSIFSVSLSVPEERVKDLVACGMESGCYGSFTIVGFEPENIEDNPECNYRHIDTPFLGGTILMKDKFGDEPTVYRLDRKALQAGLIAMGAKYPKHMANFLDENDDAITGDVFLQCALLGEIVYG